MTAPASDPAQIVRALQIANELIAAGVPLFVAPPCPGTSCKRPGHNKGGHLFDLPSGWETSRPTPDVVNRWRPGWALAAVCGHTIDVLDVDPRHGGDTTVTGLQQAGLWPQTYGQASTPSGGQHHLIAPLRIAKANPIPGAEGVDLQSGKPDGGGRAFIFIAPTLGRSKVDGELHQYVWLAEPDLAKLAESADSDDSGAGLAELVESKRRPKTPPASPGLLTAAPAASDAVRARVDELAAELGRVPEGQGNNEATRIGFLVGQYVGAGQLTLDEAYNRLAAGTNGWTWRDDASRHTLYASLQRALEDGRTQPRPWAEPTPAFDQAQLLRDILGHDPTPAPVLEEPSGWATGKVDVSNTATAAQELRHEAGRGRLAGLFKRLDTVVHTPREGEDGYVPLGDGDDQDGPAQVRPISDSGLASRITYTYEVYRLVKQGEDWVPKPALFPRTAARTALDVPDMLPNLRPLRGVIHSPVCRPDGTLITAPGYDPATGLLHLPEPGLTMPDIPDQPSGRHLAAAVNLVGHMLEGFPFVNEHYRANYIGALLTPLLRAIAPPPYKLHAIEAHQPGSGKTLLANLARHIHGGVFRAEMPDDDTELRKQITAILGITTGPVIVLDNVSGALKSSTLAGLLTSAQWDDRPLGSTAWTRATNDRIWTITGNNLAIGGDLPRRTIRTVIDPGQPNPELRTGFTIPDLEAWVKQHRGGLLTALLIMVRAWVVAGMPLPAARASDGYSKWVRTVEGILTHCGIPGQFDHPTTQIEVGADDDDWATFLTAVHKAYDTNLWTAKALLSDVDTNGTRHLVNPAVIPVDALPGDLEARLARPGAAPAGLAKTLSWWLRNREGRWAGGLAVRAAGTDEHKTKLWRIVTDLPRSSGNPATSVTSGSPARPRTTDPLHTVTNGSSGTTPTAPEIPEIPGYRMIMETGQQP